MTDRSGVEPLLALVKRYFGLMYDSDVSSFDFVFQPTARLHGLSNGTLRMLAAQDYKDMLAGAPSPKSRNAPREEQILLVDLASPTQAMVKVRVRADTIVYVDYLCCHCIEGNWLITSKAFHVESRSSGAGP
jgi:hypothetical protein